MSDRFYPATITKLLQMIFTEYEDRNHIFGIPKELFVNPQNYTKCSMRRYGQLLESPVGVAAGPHTQLAQNIISAWLTGARYIELKTVQTLDEIEVTKPCIDIEDEGYNCEWSQELKLEQSFDEYLKAWIIIHILKHKFGWDNSENELGTIFNMSVGYSLAGIHNENVQNFLKNMRDSDPLRTKYIEEVALIYPAIRDLHIPSRISNNLTLSTMHGCPPDEIEKIGLYLIEELNLHTTIKLNPTLLGPDNLRDILNHKLGFSTVVPDMAFEHDLKYKDAISILENLTEAAEKENVDFSIKLTNTLESENIRNVFPSNEKMNYMSGRAIHPLSVNLAHKLQTTFNGSLDISFSGGADAFNIPSLLKCNIKPITVSSDVLKPGGYGRIKQYLDNILIELENSNSENIEELVFSGSKNSDKNHSALDHLKTYAKSTTSDKRYKKDSSYWESIKSQRELNLFDCVAAPCESQCPTHQDIPLYCNLTKSGNYGDALDIIRWNNPMPFSTGLACDHTCQLKCTRINYDEPVKIREIKRFNAEHGDSNTSVSVDPPNGKKVAIIGSGPGGLSSASFLATKGFDVTIFEENEKPGGMLVYALPEFRLPQASIDKDIERIRSLGVTILCNHKIDQSEFARLKVEFDYIHISVGSQKGKAINLQGTDNSGVVDFISFLKDVNEGKTTSVPDNTVIIGGGNSAMDAARTALRLANKNNVSIVYRRTQKEMPADYEEITSLLEEGIKVHELLSPIGTKHDNGKLSKLICNQMVLGEPDESGRRRPVPVKGKTVDIEAEMVIVAVGQNSNLDFLENSQIQTTKWGTIIVDNRTKETSVENIYSGGDIVHGPKSIIQAIADGKEAAIAIFEKEGISPSPKPQMEKELSIRDLRVKRATRNYGSRVNEIPLENRHNFDVVIQSMDEDLAKSEADRCLQCDEFCDVCVTVCPNRANISWNSLPKSYNLRNIKIINGQMEYGNPYKFEISQIPQVLNLADFCNECGNCTTFCPTSGRPFADKASFYLDKKVFDEETDVWHLDITNNVHTIYYKTDKVTYKLISSFDDDYYHLETSGSSLKLAREDFSIAGIETGPNSLDLDMSIPASMSVYLDSSMVGQLKL